MFSLNYDLMAYWALLAGTNRICYDKFKHCFTGDRTFNLGCAKEIVSYSNGKPETTSTFYHHSNLILKEIPQEGEWKIHAGANFLLGSILAP